MKIRLLVSILSIAAVSVAAAKVQSPGKSRDNGTPGGPSCTIRGTVRNNRGKVVADAMIRILPRMDSAGVSLARTNADGTFSVERRPGTFVVVAEHRGVGHSRIKTRANLNQILTLDISLQKGHHMWGTPHERFHLGTHGAQAV